MRRRSRRSAAERTYKLCSLLLCYPDEELLGAREQIADAVGSELERFCAWWSAEDPIALQQHYVEVFDLHKRCSLYLTFYAEGDRRDRGLALLRLKRIYRAAGLPLEGPELPDYLPVMLEFAAAAPDGYGTVLLREHRPALELLHGALSELATPYATVLEALCAMLGAPSAADRARAIKLAASGPPTERVGLEPFGPPQVMTEARP